MNFIRANLANCADATGLAVAIDVLRAYTTAAYLFSAGVECIILVGSVDEAFALRQQLPGSLILGEIDGIQVTGFDLGNSPSALAGLDLQGKTIIQRTSTGTQGVVRAAHASPILTAALTNAEATARFIRKLNPSRVTFIQTGFFPGEGWGDEDVACADLIEARLSGQSANLEQIAARVIASRSGSYYDGEHPTFPPADLDCALQFDRFPFAMQVHKKDGLHVLQAVHV